MKTMIENLINGNIGEARRQAKRFRRSKIWNALIHEYGWSVTKATLASHFLKTGEGWQQYCDAK